MYYNNTMSYNMSIHDVREQSINVLIVHCIYLNDNNFILYYLVAYKYIIMSV